jgi:hypothetical protein
MTMTMAVMSAHVLPALALEITGSASDDAEVVSAALSPQQDVGVLPA